MPEPLWQRRMRWSMPENPWFSPPLHTWSWQFLDDRGNGRGRWFVEPSTGGPLRPAAPDLPTAYSCGIALATNFAIAGSATPQGFTIHRIEPDQPSLQLFHSHERTDVGTLSADETLVSLLHAEEGDWLHPSLYVYTCTGERVARLWDGPGYGLRTAAWSPLPGDQRLIILRERSGYWQPALWLPETNEVRDLPLDLPDGDITANWFPDAQHLLLTHEWHGRNKLYRFDLETNRLSHIPTEPGSIWASGVRSDGVVWYRWNNATRPSENRTETGEYIAAPANADIPPATPYQDIDVDGIHVFLAEPATPRPHPTVFVVYAHPEFHYRDAFFPKLQVWVDHGFALVILNCHGSNGYGRAWRDASLGNVGWTELEDIDRVYDHLVHEGIIDPERVVLNGQSWGGYLTLFGLGVQPERWSLGIAELPVADFVTCYNDSGETIQAVCRVQFGGTPAHVPQAYHKASPLTYVEQVQAPVLLIIGERDHLCPLSQNENYIHHLQTSGKVHEVYRHPGGHWDYDGEALIPAVEVQIRFVEKHLGLPQK